MKLNIRRWLFAIALLLVITPQARGQVSVEMKLDTADILVGQQVMLSTMVSADAKQHVKFPDYKEGEELLKGLEVVHQSKVDTTYLNDNKRVQLSRHYTITSFDSAIYNIPAMAVVVDADTFRATTAAGLKVSMVPVDTTQLDQFAGPHAVVPDSFIWRDKLLILSLGLWLILLFIVVVSIKLTCRKPLTTKKVIKPQIPPFKQASTAVDGLNIHDIRDKADAKDFFVKLTDALRVYVERRFGIQALEKTTNELLEALNEKIDAQQKENLKFVFETADLVKFAKFMPSDFDIERCLASANQFLDTSKDETMEHPEPEVQIIVLNDGMQHKYRVMLWVALGILLVGGLAYAVFVTRSIYTTFF